MNKGLPLAPRTLLYPLFGARAINGPIGLLADASCLIAVVAGTVGPIGFLGLRISYGLNALLDLPDSFATQAVVIMGLVAVATFSVMSGRARGIQTLSRANVILAFALLIFMLVAGPTGFIFSAVFSAMETYLTRVFGLALYRGDAGLFGAPGWLDGWTVFFSGWFLGYGPLMAVLIACVSRGRSIRAVIIMLSIVAPLVTNFWFTLIGGAGISFEIATPGAISGPFEGFNPPAGLLATTQQMPLGFIVPALFLVLTIIFVATTRDSMRFVIASTMSGDDPAASVRAFWALAMGAMAIILVRTGAGGVGKLQSFIVITAAPVSLVLLASVWSAPRITLALGRT